MLNNSPVRRIGLLQTLDKAIERRIKAEVSHSWIGTRQCEDDRHAIEQELNNARTNLQAKLQNVRDLLNP